jgi:hypothetical protein
MPPPRALFGLVIVWTVVAAALGAAIAIETTVWWYERTAASLIPLIALIAIPLVLLYIFAHPKPPDKGNTPP